jgi:hypothetical protein
MSDSPRSQSATKLSLDLEGTDGAWVMRGDPTKDVPTVAHFQRCDEAEEYVTWKNANGSIRHADGSVTLSPLASKLLDRLLYLADCDHYIRIGVESLNVSRLALQLRSEGISWESAT